MEKNNKYTECQYCKEKMRADAAICPHCRKRQSKELGAGEIIAIVAIVLICVFMLFLDYNVYEDTCNMLDVIHIISYIGLIIVIRLGKK